MTPRPLALLAELTYRCPLHCPYCSNPPRHHGGSELTAAEWQRVLREAADLGVMHVGFSGGEPLLRQDLAQIVASARELGLYSNLLTSGVGLTAARARELRSAGLDSLQLSFQADQPEVADTIAGARVHALKIEAAAIARDAGFPLSVNVVLHRANIDRLEQIVELAESLGAQHLELANTQYYGWASLNRAALLPTKDQVARALIVAQAAKKRLAGRIEIFYVLPDYFESRPKPCMQGWGQRYITVNGIGDALPCPTATVIPNLSFENVRERSLEWIWSESESFNRFRGIEWMPEPCRSCPQQATDFGGCRCQAAILAGDSHATDPVCIDSPFHDRVLALIEGPRESSWIRRENPQPIGA